MSWNDIQRFDEDDHVREELHDLVKSSGLHLVLREMANVISDLAYDAFEDLPEDVHHMDPSDCEKLQIVDILDRAVEHVQGATGAAGEAAELKNARA